MKINCAKCGQSLEIEKKYVGEMFECPTCKQLLHVISIYSERPPLPERPRWNLTDEQLEAMDFDEDEMHIADVNPNRTLFFDIETSGAPFDRRAEITTICWWMGGQWGAYVAGLDSPDAFINAWQLSEGVVSYNGISFDERYICRKFDIEPHEEHFDLFKFFGGKLKDNANEHGFERPAEMDGMDGASAPKQWSRFISKGCPEELRQLLYYNAWDVLLTYQLYCAFIRRSVDRSIIDSVPFKPNTGADSVCTIIVDNKPSKAELSGLWEQRKASPMRSICGAEFCFTGRLENATREETNALVAGNGGIVRSTATRTLDYLVLGDTGKYEITSKQKKAEKLIEDGSHVQIIDEARFWELVPEDFRCRFQLNDGNEDSSLDLFAF